MKNLTIINLLIIAMFALTLGGLIFAFCNRTLDGHTASTACLIGCMIACIGVGGVVSLAILTYNHCLKA